MNVSSRLLDICNFYRINVTELADTIGVSKSTVLSYTRENSSKGPVMPGLDLAPKIFNAFPKLSYEWFFFGRGEIEKQDVAKEGKKEDFERMYYDVLRKYSCVQEELIECLKGHTEGLPPMRTPVRSTE